MPGSRLTVVVPASSFHDLAGNDGEQTIIVEADIPQGTIVSSIRGAVTVIAPLTASLSVGASLASSALSAVGAAATAQAAAQSNLLRSGHHFQIMSMSASLAVPAVPGRCCSALRFIRYRK